MLYDAMLLVHLILLLRAKMAQVPLTLSPQASSKVFLLFHRIVQIVHVSLGSVCKACES